MSSFSDTPELYTGYLCFAISHVLGPSKVYSAGYPHFHRLEMSTDDYFSVFAPSDTAILVDVNLAPNQLEELRGTLVRDLYNSYSCLVQVPIYYDKLLAWVADFSDPVTPPYSDFSPGISSGIDRQEDHYFTTPRKRYCDMVFFFLGCFCLFFVAIQRQPVLYFDILPNYLLTVPSVVVDLDCAFIPPPPDVLVSSGVGLYVNQVVRSWIVSFDDAGVVRPPSSASGNEIGDYHNLFTTAVNKSGVSYDSTTIYGGDSDFFESDL